MRVLRMSEGDLLYLTDGCGTLYTARLVDNSPKGCEVKIEHVEYYYRPRSYYLHVAVALTKNLDRYEWMLEKMTEIGVDEITPIICEHSERRTWKSERAEKILISAMKQSLKAYLPKLNNAVSFSDFVAQPFDGKILIAHCQEGEVVPLSRAIQGEQKIMIVIGPEGDFSPHEIDLALAAGYEAVNLGSSRFRTETAGVLACATVCALNQL